MQRKPSESRADRSERSRNTSASSDSKRRGQKKEDRRKIRTERLEFSQDFLPIKSISDGIIQTKDGQFLKILEVMPINFPLLSQSEQEEIIYNFASWLKIAPNRIQFKVITRKAYAARHIVAVRKDLETETDKRCLALADNYIQLIQHVSDSDALTRRFFLIFSYQAVNGVRNDYTDVQNELATIEAMARQYFLACGNEIRTSENPDYDLAEILYTMFNRRSCVSEPFERRVNRIVVDAMASKNLTIGVDEVPVIRDVNFFAPRGLDFTHPNYIIMDGQYYTFLYVTGDGYPNKVRPGWLTGLINAGSGVDVDIHLEKLPRSKVVDKVSQKIRLNFAKMAPMSATARDYDELNNAITAGYYIKDAIANTNQDLYYMSLFITISSDTYDGMIWRRKQVEDMLKAQDVQTRQCRYKMEEALRSVMPVNDPAINLQLKARRNILTYGAACAYPFTSYELSDENGVMFGVNRYNNSLCLIDLFNTAVNKNANMFIIGSSGAGKTFTLQLMALRMRMRGVQSIIIAPLKGHEFKRACEATGGQYIKLAAGSAYSINIMEIRNTTSPDMELIHAAKYEDESILAKKIQQVLTFINLLITDLTNEEEQMVDEALIQTYKDFGITFENDSLYLDKSANPPKMKPMPILADLQKNLEKNPLTKRVAIILSRFVSGSAQSFNRQTNVDLDNKYIVIDLSSLGEKLLPLGMFTAMDYVLDAVQADIMQKKAVFLDELWRLLGTTANRFAAEFCLNMFKVIRGYGGAAIGSTQDLRDFFGLDGGTFGHGIINACQNKIILGLQEDEAEYVREAFDLSDAELKSICRFGRGQAMIYSSNSKAPVLITASPLETELITTDPKQLREIAQKRKEAHEAEIQRLREQAEA